MGFTSREWNKQVSEKTAERKLTDPNAGNKKEEQKKK